MKVKVKIRNDPNEQLQKCFFYDVCPFPCDWCKQHDYSEACVPALQERVKTQRKTILALLNKLPDTSGCKWCEDSAGMVVTVISQLKDGITAGVVGGNWAAEFCPFCGRKFAER